ncbi:spectrin repeat-containing domain protein [Ancylostoma duodenale]|uniref:Spectrin repeat-containing domain protein n=1 Tax=Ancylostoma duodenale TaxID=51022 RepID=A0A0C2FU87_9BILA|nr:spectrin repeat-containing domain protein [Ancylostoma duodenale]
MELEIACYRDLIAAMEDAMAFHTDMASLLAWLDDAETRLAKLPAAESLKVDEISRLLDELHVFKDEMDKQAVLKEQLSYTAGQIASGAPAHQAAAIRQPINKLNLRWSQLYAALCDKENKVERMLLQMGRLSEAADQLIAWMRKTRGTLDELSVAAPTLRQLEIQRCQLTVVSNDVHAHENSVLSEFHRSHEFLHFLPLRFKIVQDPIYRQSSVQNLLLFELSSHQNLELRGKVAKA